MRAIHFRTLALTCALGMSALDVRAQTYTILHNFGTEAIDSVTSANTNADGAEARARLVVSGGVLYGVASQGGSNSVGTVFRLDTDGGNFTNLFTFGFSEASGGDTADPFGGLLLLGNTLYGTTMTSTNLSGTIFAIQTDGTGYKNLYTFTQKVSGTNSDGSNPRGALMVLGNMLYGTASAGGAYGYGTVFGIETNGSGFTNLHNFQYTDGSAPESELVSDGTMLYGTTVSGGPGTTTNGTIFAISTNGLLFSTYHGFSGLSGSGLMTNSDGSSPSGGLTLSGSRLYGATTSGGVDGYGTVYTIDTGGTNFSSVVSFVKPYGTHVNSDLVLLGGTIYGTTQNGSVSTNTGGTIFSVNTDGTGLTTLLSHRATGTGGTNSNGAACQAGMTYSGGVFYGVDAAGGTNGAGLVFSLVVSNAAPEPIPLNIQLNGPNVVLSWTNAGFGLQASPLLGGSFTNVAGAASPFTVPATNPQEYWRLEVN